MAIPSELRSALADLVHLLVTGNYTQLEADGRSGRLSASELERAIHEYGHVLVDLPDQAFELGNAYPLDGQQSAWAVDLDLWTADEGRSDLTLTARAWQAPDAVRVEIDDLHML